MVGPHKRTAALVVISGEYIIMHDGMRTSGLTHKPSLELETGLKCVSGQGEYSVNQKHLMFPTGVVYPLSKILMFGDNYFPHWLYSPLWFPALQ